MHVLDASSLVQAWDHYPKELFPKLWEWIELQLLDGCLQIPSVVFGEVTYKFPECGKWLSKLGVRWVLNNNDILQEASRLKKLLNIEEDGYHPKGVDENDLIIIATASVRHATLVSNESPFKNNPDLLRKRKIPVVCSMGEVNVTCINFLDYIKESKQRF